MKKEKFLPAQDLVTIESINNGIIHTKDGRYVKIIEVTPINFHMRSNREKNLIISDFMGWIKIAPIKFQFKVLSLPADINGHIEGLHYDMEHETNEKCKELQEDYLNLICNVGLTEGVTRRFFIVYEYESANVFNNEDGIIRDMLACEQTIRTYMKQCGNKVVAHDDETVFLYELFYSIYNRIKYQSVGERLQTASFLVSISAKKLPFPHAGSKKRLSIRSVSSFTRSHMAFTSRSAVKTSPWSATLFLDLT